MGDSLDSDDDSDSEDGPSPEGGQQRVAMQQEPPRVPILPDRPRAMQGMAAVAEASATLSRPIPDMLRVPGSGSYSGSRTPTSASMSTSVTTSGLSRTSASSAQRSSEAEITRQRVRHTDRSRNYEGESKYAQGKGEGRKRKGRKDKRRREPQPSSELVPCQGYGAPAPYAPNQRVNEAEARERQLFLRDTNLGQLHAATVIETLFADLGLDSVPSAPPWTQAPFPSRGREPFRGSHGSYRGRPPVTPA
jgi:hypothetical protein